MRPRNSSTIMGVVQADDRDVAYNRLSRYVKEKKFFKGLSVKENKWNFLHDMPIINIREWLVKNYKLEETHFLNDFDAIPEV